MRRLKASSERGAVTVVVAFGLVVLIGFAAFAIDAGGLYLERRELQNGADAAALAVAQDCASNPSLPVCTNAGARPRAQQYANANARDSLSTVPASGVMIDKPAGKVTVAAVTNDPSSSDPTRLRHFFAPIFGISGTAVEARGAALWGPIAQASVDTIPLAISACEWEKAYLSGSYPASEPWTVANNGPVQVIVFHKNAAECELETGIVGGSPSGQQVPGGFGWLDTYDGKCMADIIDGWMGSSTGNSPSNNCTATWLEQNVLGKVIALPVFDGTNLLTGNNAEFRYASYAAIYVTGYYLGSSQYNKSLPGFPAPCSGSQRCIGGWFTNTTAGGGEIDPTAPNTGVNTIQMTLP